MLGTVRPFAHAERSFIDSQLSIRRHSSSVGLSSLCAREHARSPL